jgi:hypothetical protein
VGGTGAGVEVCVAAGGWGIVVSVGVAQDVNITSRTKKYPIQATVLFIMPPHTMSVFLDNF